MALTRKSRSVNKRYSDYVDFFPSKNAANKSGRQKRKLSEMLGSPWTDEEVERFYKAYRKYGKDWKKVAVMVRSRNSEMVEALYTMNRAYLSLPEGMASVVGFIAMVSDQYNALEGSDNDQEGNNIPKPVHKPKRHSHGVEEQLQPRLVASTDRNMPQLKRRASDDETCALDALKMLADVSFMIQTSKVDSVDEPEPEDHQSMYEEPFMSDVETTCVVETSNIETSDAERNSPIITGDEMVSEPEISIIGEDEGEEDVFTFTEDPIRYEKDSDEEGGDGDALVTQKDFMSLNKLKFLLQRAEARFQSTCYFETVLTKWTNTLSDQEQKVKELKDELQKEWEKRQAFVKFISGGV